MISDWTTKEFKGFCFIEFESQEDASAVVKMDGMEMGGRRLKIVRVIIAGL
jgi:RNA recognition motif-containing protein